jgi:hypothetical protein
LLACKTAHHIGCACKLTRKEKDMLHESSDTTGRF